MPILAEQLCSEFESILEKPDLVGVARCSPGRVLLLVTPKPEADIWLAKFEEVEFSKEGAPRPESVILDSPFEVRVIRGRHRNGIFRSAKNFLLSIFSALGDGTNIYPGLPIIQASLGTLGGIVSVDGEKFFISAEHVLADAKENVLSYVTDAIVGIVNKSNGGLTTEQPKGDFALGAPCPLEVRLAAMPGVCEGVFHSGEWITRDQLANACGLSVVACAQSEKRRAEVLGVSACVKVSYSNLANSPVRFDEQIILKAADGYTWKDGDSGALIVTEDDFGDIKRGAAVGIVFCLADRYLCATPFYRIVESLGGDVAIVPSGA
jgi:co-chaperonin GroES (HSP10)